jgi:hypothetical protein
MTKARYATLPEKMKMHQLILANSDPVDGDENVRRWKPGHNLSTTAAAAGDGLELHHCRDVAKAMGITVTLPSTKQTDSDRIDALERRLTALEKLVRDINEN